MGSIQQLKLFEQFQCLKETCPDTCCYGWTMCCDKKTEALYKEHAPELLNAIEKDGDRTVFKQDTTSHYCKQFDQGKCSIHTKHGEEFLSDACFFYPRMPRAFGKKQRITASLGCPEVARYLLEHDHFFDYVETTSPRTRPTTKNYLPEGVDVEEAYRINDMLVQAVDQFESAEIAIKSFVSIGRSFYHLPRTSWLKALPFLLQNVEEKLLRPQVDVKDISQLLYHTLVLIQCSSFKDKPNIQAMTALLLDVLEVSYDPSDKTLLVSAGHQSKLVEIKKYWTHHGGVFDTVLRRWMKAQISFFCFPFGGFGAHQLDYSYMFAVRFATIKLMIMCYSFKYKTMLRVSGVTQLIAAISRFIDHIEDPSLSLALCREAGWFLEARASGLVDILTTLDEVAILENGA